MVKQRIWGAAVLASLLHGVAAGAADAPKREYGAAARVAGIA